MPETEVSGRGVFCSGHCIPPSCPRRGEAETWAGFQRTLFLAQGGSLGPLSFPEVPGLQVDRARGPAEWEKNQPCPQLSLVIVLLQGTGATRHPPTPGNRSPCGHCSFGSQGPTHPLHCLGPLQARPHLHAVELLAPQRQALVHLGRGTARPEAGLPTACLLPGSLPAAPPAWWHLRSWRFPVRPRAQPPSRKEAVGGAGN